MNSSILEGVQKVSQHMDPGNAAPTILIASSCAIAAVGVCVWLIGAMKRKISRKANKAPKKE